MPFQKYIEDIQKQFKTGIAREHAYRPALKNLIEDIMPNVTAVNDPAHIKCGAPDFILQNTRKLEVGYIEAKDVGIDLSKTEKTDQLSRYLESLDNLVLDEPSQFSHTGYLVEIRKASDHFRLSAHATTYSKEVLIHNNRSIEVIELDTVAKEARKTVYDGKDGTITQLRASWSVEANGYQSDYEEIDKQTNQQATVDAEWEKYDAVLLKAEVLAR